MRARRGWLLIIALTGASAPARGEVELELAERVPETIDAWVEAQVKGDAAAYAKLYHRDFTGLEGAPPALVRVSRAGWLERSRRALGKHERVRVEKIFLQVVSEKVARVRLTEVRESGGRTVLTRKELTLALRGKALLIRGERSLGAVAPEAERLKQAAPVLGQRVVLSADPREDWGTGPVRAEKTPRQSIRVVRDVALAKLPAELRAWVGRRVQLLGIKGALCQAKISRLELIGRVEGMESETLDDQMHNASRLLVGVLTGAPRACALAFWARSVSLPAPRVTPALPPEAALKDAALAAFRALPEHRRIQASYRRWQRTPPEGQKAPKKPKAARWDEADGKPKVVVLRSSSPSLTLVSVSASAWVSDEEGGCQDSYRTALWGLWEVEAGAAGKAPRLRLRNRPNEGVSLRPAAMADLDGDGQVEILIDEFSDRNQPNPTGQYLQLDHGILYQREGTFDDLEGLAVPVLICPC